MTISESQLLLHSIERVLRSPKLKSIVTTLQPGENVQNLLLYDQEKIDLIQTYNAMHNNYTLFETAQATISDDEYQTICAKENAIFKKLMANTSGSLIKKVLINQSTEYEPFIRVYKVNGVLPAGKRPKNIVLLNQFPSCHKLNDCVKKMLGILYENEFFQANVFSTTAKFARKLFETQQINGVFNADWISTSINPTKQGILNVLNIKNEDDSYCSVEFNNYFLGLPMNIYHDEPDDFIEELKEKKRAEQGVLFMDDEAA